MSGGATTPGRAELLADYEALRHRVGARRLARDVLVVHGPDAAEYLQGQCTQDLARLGAGEAVPSLVLEPDGKVSALVRVTRLDEDRFALDTDGGWGDVLAARLRRFLLRVKAVIEPVPWPCVALRGPAAGVVPGAVAGAAVAGEGTPAAGPVWVLAVEWNGTVGADALGPGAAAVVPSAARWCGEAAWEALRVEAGIPAMGSELDARTIPAEAGLVGRTVSLTKGCYTGQELVARLDARGSRVPRRLCGLVTAAGPVDEAGPAGRLDGSGEGLVGAVLRGGSASDRPVGSVTSAAWCPGLGSVAALGYVHRSVPTGETVTWAPGPDAPVAGRLRVVGLPIVAGEAPPNEEGREAPGGPETRGEGDPGPG